MNKPINVYLDDLRDCPAGFVLVKNIERLKKLIVEHDIDILSLDHNLGVDSSSPNYKDVLDDDFLWLREHYLRPNETPFVNVFGHTPTVLIHKSPDVWMSEDRRYIGIDVSAFMTGQLNESGDLLQTYQVEGE